MELTVFGNNASWPSAGGACSCYLLQAGNEKVMLDMGNGTMAKLQPAVDLARLSLIIISHLHFDHFGELFCAKYQLETRRAMGEDIPVITLLIPKPDSALEEQLTEGNVFRLMYIHDGMIFVTPGGLRVECIATRHTTEAYGFRISDSARVLAYSGDSGPCDNLQRIALHADLFLCESGVSEKGPAVDHHLSPAQALACAAGAEAKRVLLTHYHPEDAETISLAITRNVLQTGMRIQLAKMNQTYQF